MYALANHSKLEALEDAGQGVRRPERVCSKRSRLQRLRVSREREKKETTDKQKQPDVLRDRLRLAGSNFGA